MILGAPPRRSRDHVHRLRRAVVAGDSEVGSGVVIRQAFYEQATVLQAVDVEAQVTTDVVFTARLRVAMEVTASSTTNSLV